MIQLIAFDLADTFLRQDRSYDRNRFNSLYKSLAAKGIQFMVASGNNLGVMEAYFDEEVKASLHFGAETCNLMVYQGQVERVTALDWQTVSEVVAWADQFKDFNCLVATNVRNYASYLSPEDVTYFAKRHKLVGKDQQVEIIEDFSLIPTTQWPLKVALMGHQSLAADKIMQQKAQAAFPHLKVVTSGNRWVDIFNIQGGKGAGLAYLQEKYGVSPQDTMVFGDSMNDASMMMQAHYSMVMANGDDQLKTLANYHIGDNDSDAVLTILSYLDQERMDKIEQFRISY